MALVSALRQVIDKAASWVARALPRRRAHGTVLPTGAGAAEGGYHPLQEVAERLHEIFWIVDGEAMRVEYISPAFEPVWGRSRAELYRDPRTLLRSVHSGDRRRVGAAIRDVRAGTRELELEFRVVRPGGAVRWLRARGAPMMARARRAARFGGVIEDVTDRRRREVARRFLAEAGRGLGSSLDEEEILRAVARLAVPTIADYCAVFLTEEGGGVRQVEIAHADPGKQPVVHELSTRYDLDPQGLIHRVTRRKQPVAGTEISESLLRRLGGDARHRELLRQLEPRSYLLAPLVARGHALGVILLVAGESGREYGPADLGFARELAHRVGLAVDNARLYHAALAASQAKSDFLAVMSHELRTPLTAIMGYTDLVRSEVPGPVNSRQEEHLERIEFGANQLLRLIDEILTFSRLEAGRESARTEQVDLPRLVRDVVSLVQPRVREKGLDLRLRLPDPSTRIQTDPVRLRHILRGLLSNAVKFTDEGVVELVVAAEPDELLITIHDTGVGIPEGAQEKIFEPFWQAETATTREAGGAGLGLSVARRLAHLLGGGIRVESEPGRGSTFTLRLPTPPATVRSRSSTTGPA